MSEKWEPNDCKENAYWHEWYSDKPKYQHSLMWGTSREESSYFAWHRYRISHHMTHEVIVVVVSCEEEPDKWEYARDDMIASDLFPETHEDDDVDREDEYPLPPAKYTDIELEVELINHRKSRSWHGDNSNDFEIGEIGYTFEKITRFLREEIERHRSDRHKEYPEYSESEYGWVERQLHRERIKKIKLVMVIMMCRHYHGRSRHHSRERYSPSRYLRGYQDRSMRKRWWEILL